MSSATIYRRFMAQFAGKLRKQADECKTAARAMHVGKNYGSDISMSFVIEGQYFEVSFPGGTSETDELLETLSNYLVGYGHHLHFTADIAEKTANGVTDISGPGNAPEGP